LRNVLARDHLDRANHVAPGSCLQVGSCRLRGASEQQRSDRGHQRPQKHSSGRAHGIREIIRVAASGPAAGFSHDADGRSFAQPS